MNCPRQSCTATCSPGLKEPSGVAALSTSLLNTHRCPARRRRSSPRRNRSTRATPAAGALGGAVAAAGATGFGCGGVIGARPCGIVPRILLNGAAGTHDHASQRPPQSPGERNQPLPAPARRQSGRLVSLGRGGAGARAPAAPADPAVDRLRRLPLVPRHGARILRGRGYRGADERALRQRQGGSRGAPGPRPPLPARPPTAEPARWRLAADDVPDARRPATLLWRHLLPAASRATACQPSATLLQRVADYYREHAAGIARQRRRGWCAPSTNCSRRRRAPSWRSTPRRCASAAQQLERSFDRDVGRFRRRAQVPARAAGAAAAARLARRARAATRRTCTRCTWRAGR